MVVDTPALLAVFFNEEQGPAIADVLEESTSLLRMSTVNLAETLILIRDRQPQLFDSLRESLLQSALRFVPPTVKQSEIAAKARAQYPLNLGDCFCYAIAIDEKVPILTLDKDFLKTDAKLVRLK